MSASTVAVIGGGVVGGGWVARLSLNGHAVRVHDPDPQAERKIGEICALARRAYAKLTLAPQPEPGAITFHPSIGAAVRGADWIVEAVPERLDLKRMVYASIEIENQGGIIASTTSGFRPSDLQDGLQNPERLIVAHPFVPVYLVPLVEVVAGEKTDPAAVETAKRFLSGLGMYPLHVKKEIDAFIADRFLEAVWREALWLIRDGYATTEEVDEAIRMGFGLRWAQMGLFEGYRIAGGEAGMRHFIAQFGPALQWPWTRLTDVPELDETLIELIAGQSDAQSGHLGIRELEAKRDDNLVAILQALKVNDWGAGRVLAAHEKRLFDLGAKPPPDDISQPVETLRLRVPPDWTDYNNHMNEARYLQAFADATDALMRLIGCDADYIAAGGSYFTVETHIRHLDEARAGEEIHATTQVLEGAGKKMRLFHRLWRGADLLATGEHMLIHVSLKTRAASAPGALVAEKLAEIAALHAGLPVPDGAGRAVGMGR
ncbi:MAG: carnitine 3-dehydrogenase [Alphaproteobacteria bacterium]|nr:MAG: carnitine 3-dehydrogenase [Alphaproteobacteria bacterium]